jgi:hypothetical protein
MQSLVESDTKGRTLSDYDCSFITQKNSTVVRKLTRIFQFSATSVLMASQSKEPVRTDACQLVVLALSRSMVLDAKS